MRSIAVEGTATCGYVPLLMMCSLEPRPDSIDVEDPADDVDLYCQLCGGTMYVQVWCLWSMLKPRNLSQFSGSRVTGSL